MFQFWHGLGLDLAAWPLMLLTPDLTRGRPVAVLTGSVRRPQE